MRDMLNGCDYKRGISPAAATTDDTAWVSQILDMQNLDGAVFVITIGALADANATFAVLAEEGDDASLSDNAAISDDDLIGTEALAGFQYDDDNEVRKLGFRPSGKRYKRVTVTPTGNTGNAFVSGVWVTCPRIRPTANPPA